MDESEIKTAIRAIVNEYLRDMSMQALAEEISLTARGITFSRQTVHGWRNGGNVDTDRIALVARYGRTERAREFGRRILAAKGLQLL